MLRAVGVEVGMIVGMFVVVGMLMGMGVGGGQRRHGYALWRMGVLMLVVMAAGHMFGIDMHRKSLLEFFPNIIPAESASVKTFIFVQISPGRACEIRRKKVYYKKYVSPEKEGQDDGLDHTPTNAATPMTTTTSMTMPISMPMAFPDSHGHVHENQKAVLNRLSRAIGHLEKVKRMVEEGHELLGGPHPAGGGAFRAGQHRQGDPERPHAPLHGGRGSRR